MASPTAVQVHMCRAASRAGGGAELLLALAFESERRPDEGLEALPTLANRSQSGVDRLPPRVRQGLRRAAPAGTALRKSVASRAVCIAAESPVALARALPGEAKSMADVGPAAPAVEQGADLILDRLLASGLLLRQHAKAVTTSGRRSIAS